jgi:hypothetical protein
LCINAEDVFKLLDYHDHGLMLNHAIGFGSKAPLKKLRNLCLTLGRGRWQFQSRLRSLGSLKLASTCLRALIQMSSEQRKLQVACLLEGYSEREDVVFPDFDA